ncbi:single-stranded DNA-binding protein [Arthrobacter echini]|uniref:Single-stranded DNA-binding protein n=1 Tax=Arthrobacter echini TaxID=1529066 RepID=A0A4S5E644_9MICC|nr:single-stranded DNA-binding protein [Arthrobacter echini]THJ66988.1 single-stranded DNA-binding protein [Arthrobacter echini]
MTDIITVRGYVATEVRLAVAHSGLPISSFRMCSTERRFDKEANGWVDGTTNWYSVSMFRQLATNAGASIKKGDRVIATGRLRIRPWTTADGRTGTSVEIDADTVGHDLMWGTANFRRNSADRAQGQSGSPESSADGSGEHDLPEGVDPGTGEVYDGVFGSARDEGAADGAAGAVSTHGPDTEEHDGGNHDALHAGAVPF